MCGSRSRGRIDVADADIVEVGVALQLIFLRALISMTLSHIRPRIVTISRGTDNRWGFPESIHNAR